MKKIAILGSTGSIGTSTLNVVAAFPGNLKVIGLAAGRNTPALRKQIEKFRPKWVTVGNEPEAAKLRSDLKGRKLRTGVLAGEEGLNTIIEDPIVEAVVLAVSGAAGLKPALATLKAGKQLALANKESLVMGGELLLRASRRFRAPILPIDSEHSALFQLLEHCRPRDVRRLFLTASGGPFLHRSRKSLRRVTPKEALSHPVWKMGKKVSIDSATLMNKGLEIIEAHHLFGMTADRIRTVIHPQSRVHALVELKDGSFLAHLGIPDMKIPIAYALSYPDRWELNLTPLSLGDLGELAFSPADERLFPALRLAYAALAQGGTMPAVLSIANEVAVDSFLKKWISFPQIIELVERVMNRRKENPRVSLEAIEAAARWARRESLRILSRWS